MKATFYPYGTNNSGFYTQRKTSEKTINVTKSDLLKIADLRHNVLTKREYFEVLSTDLKGKTKERF